MKFSLITIVTTALVLASSAHVAHAQWPNKPIRIIVPFPAGGPTDITARVVGQAIAGRRDEVFLVSKVLPANASTQGTIAACERSLERLGTDHLDLYLLHWRGEHPLAATCEAFHQLKEQGKIRVFGVSNFDFDDIEELRTCGRGMPACNQILYHLNERGTEFALLPHQRMLGISTMAYSPFDEGRLLGESALNRIAGQAGATPAQVALAWLLAQPGVCAIPKSANQQRVKENCAAAELRLSPETLDALDAAFPPPTRARPLAMI